MTWDVAVVGAGAAGLLAATRAALRGRRTLLLEKNRHAGVKILMSGGTRCNLTHATDAQGIVKAYGPPGRFLHSALAALGPRELVALFEAEGVATKIEETGKIFPESNKASDVLDALLAMLAPSGAELSLSEPVTQCTHYAPREESEHSQRSHLARRDVTDLSHGERSSNPPARFILTTPHREVLANNIIITVGGMSYAGCGTSGDGYSWLVALGHTIVPPRPALVPITTDATWVAALSGVTIPDVLVRVVCRSRLPGETEIKQAPPGGRDLQGKRDMLAEARASFLFTHFGLSGPCVLDVSRAVSGHVNPRELDLVCDFLPAVSAEALVEHLRTECLAAGKKQLGNIVPLDVPRRLAESLLAQLGLDPQRRAAELSKTDRWRLVAAIKEKHIPISGTRGFKKAEVTAGGVSLAEVDSRTMQSKLVPGLYLAGEILDLDGPIGGYNFQAAFSTGYLAGESV